MTSFWKQKWFAIAMALFLLHAGGVTTLYYLHQRQVPNVVRIGIVNLLRVQQEAKIYRQGHERFEASFKKIHDEFSNTEKELHKQYEQLKQIKNRKKVLAQKKELDETVAKFEKTAQSKREKLEREFEQYTKAAEGNLQAAVNRLVETYGLNILLNTNTLDEASIIIYAQKGYNLTDDLIKILDQDYDKSGALLSGDPA